MVSMVVGEMEERKSVGVRSETARRTKCRSRKGTAQLIDRFPSRKSRRRRAYPQQIVTTRTTLLLTGPFRTAKSSAKDLIPRVLKLQYAKYGRDGRCRYRKCTVQLIVEYTWPAKQLDCIKDLLRISARQPTQCPHQEQPSQARRLTRLGLRGK